jgi:anaerobic selenocysteine-containing dehydrogenase
MLRKPTKRPTPSNWASLKPFGIGEQRPNNFMEVFRAGWENRDSLGYTWRILNEGVCDGCALGTKGMKDWTIPGVHLCNVRLRLLRLNTMGPLQPSALGDVASLRELRGQQLRSLGRLPEPLLRSHGEAGFTPVTWDRALDLAAEGIRSAGPERCGFFLTSRGMSNESYYAAQKAVRAIGTNSIDNAARVCHSPSTFALKDALGVGATTCSYSDWIGTDVIVFIGSNVANNQPVTTKYIHVAKKAGTKVIVVNPFREPGM